ncbi:sulfate adenylyltransferase subunit CysN [Longimicrobium sp.]|uniref:sulfate adenylyltransferase subunit CysN n=1 Tax=Longimicrobium sp. TaxID=2029185 RepID=UPI002F9234D2
MQVLNEAATEGAAGAWEQAARQYREMDLLRLTTAGSVDDGKSTLIGRLLYDTKSIFEDQLEAIEGASRRRGELHLNLALLTDGLRAEREQNITIDVAYRYFATPRRKFIIADTPGHVQYTRNMVTGASTAELAIVLVDARRGVLTQSRRHGFIASLLRIPHVVVAVNKMDLVDFSRDVYDEIVADYTAFAEKLGITDLTFIPISALHGDNIVSKSERLAWYDGATLLHHLENVNVGADRNLVDFRFPVQYVVRPHQDFRGFAGKVASGTITPGEEVVVLPSGKTTRVAAIETMDGRLAEAAEGDSVVLTTEDEVDISRGDMIVRRMNLPTVGSRFEAMLCWMGEAELDPSVSYVVQHTTRSARALVSRVVYRVNVDTLHREEVDRLQLNDIGRVEITASVPLFFDAYQLNRATGSFILVDPFTNATVAAGMIRGPVQTADELFAPRPAAPASSPGVVWEEWNVPREEREAAQGHAAAVLWFTGLSGAGKSTIARALERRLFQAGVRTMLLDGDQLRHGLNADLGFSPADRAENVRRVGEVARLFFEAGSVVLCTFVSPYRDDRARARQLVPEGRFLEVHVDCALDELRRRDPKGLYARADAGEGVELTGVSAPYEAPEHPELRLDTAGVEVDEAVEALLALLRERGLVADAGRA